MTHGCQHPNLFLNAEMVVIMWIDTDAWCELVIAAGIWTLRQLAHDPLHDRANDFCSVSLSQLSFPPRTGSMLMHAVTLLVQSSK